ncbi:hypothetical protein BH23PLA1_BH23PLA1_24440 [soil metagenome]
MSIRCELADVRRALDARDPQVVELVKALAKQPDPEPETPIRDGAPTFGRFLDEIRSRPFRRKPLEEQKHERIGLLKALEAPDAEVPLPDRLRLHEILLEFWQEDSPFARSCLLAIIAEIKLTYGPWRAIKRIFKEAEDRGDLEMFGAITARIDEAYASKNHEIGERTMAYLCRRAWRFLRRTGISFPAVYPDAAVAILAHYREDTSWYLRNSYVLNQIFYHETGKYNRSKFTFSSPPKDLLKHRAFAESWKRSPRPLFNLLERAQSNHVREFAAAALRTDFRASIREVEPAWVARLIAARSKPTDEFVVWILKNVPRFEQAAFRSLGLHDAVLRLFDSPAPEARAYAAEYARTHARDLPIDELIRLSDNDHLDIIRLVADLIRQRDPRKDVGLEAWGRLLETKFGNTLASAALREHYGPKELTPDWFRDRLLSESRSAADFARDRLLEVHPRQKLGAGFFQDLIEEIDRRRLEAYSVMGVVRFALIELARSDPNTLDQEFLKLLFVRPLTRDSAQGWVNQGKLKAEVLPLDFWKALAYHPNWDADPWISNLKRSGRAWAKDLTFDEDLSGNVLNWLRDVRKISPSDLGFDWLLQLVRRSEPRYHDFAVEVMIKGFAPADFAPKAEAPEASKTPRTAEPIQVDLGGTSFLFTGKLATMQRKEAEGKVRDAGGAVSSGVTNKLHYLVIGDEGSHLYGQGKKGSKQVKAEELNAAGANIRIISETAFLQMLKGEKREVSADATLAGCERLWEMALASGATDAPLGRFARKYLRRHHPDIALDETDRPVDPGAEVPPEFLTWERVRPLLAETRKPLRDFAIDLARWEFARWSPPAEELIPLAESPHAEVRQFLSKALLADSAPEHRRYRIDPETLEPAAVYRFCESADESARALGMKLLDRSPRLRVPEELFRLTESPDRTLRSFVVRVLWSLYRDRGITEGWKPPAPTLPTVGASAKKTAEKAVAIRGEGPPARPEQWPASLPSLSGFLRRMLFEIPPGRPPKAEASAIDGRVKPLPARRAKLELIEVLRDLAIEEEAFARAMLPPLREFMTSRGKSEHAACLVAMTRIRHAHPGLRSVTEAEAETQGAAS